MKKQILSAILLTAMVGASVAEANFTDALRVKYAGKDALTVKYVEMMGSYKHKFFGKTINTGGSEDYDPRGKRVTWGCQGEKEYQTIEYPVYEQHGTQRSLAKYSSFSKNEPSEKIVKNGKTYGFFYKDDTKKTLKIKQDKLPFGGMPINPAKDFLKVIIDGEIKGQNEIYKLITEECGKEKVMGEDYNVEKLAYTFTYKNKSYNYFYKAYYDDKGMLTYFTFPLDEKEEVKSPLGMIYFKVNSIDASFDDATYNKLNKYYNDFMANKK
ncbi:MAG: hypothetical protein MJ048_03060 [Acidaminococcaceae bacterium]|nr:hypothetical protein [Acidaminococcaceae bacterium]